MPAEAADLLRQSLERSARSTGSNVVLTLLGLALALWTTTSAAGTLMEGLTRAFGRGGLPRVRPQAAREPADRRGARRVRRARRDLPRPRPPSRALARLDPRRRGSHGVGVVDGAVAVPRRLPPARLRSRPLPRAGRRPAGAGGSSLPAQPSPSSPGSPHPADSPSTRRASARTTRAGARSRRSS